MKNVAASVTTPSTPSRAPQRIVLSHQGPRPPILPAKALSRPPPASGLGAFFRCAAKGPSTSVGILIQIRQRPSVPNLPEEWVIDRNGRVLGHDYRGVADTPIRCIVPIYEQMTDFVRDGNMTRRGAALEVAVLG